MIIIIIIIALFYVTIKNSNITENFDVSPVYYCNNCKGKTFGQCTQCLSCVWVKTLNQDDNGKIYFKGSCISGDEHNIYHPTLLMMNNNIQRAYPYSRDPFYNNPYISIF